MHGGVEGDLGGAAEIAEIGADDGGEALDPGDADVAELPGMDDAQRRLPQLRLVEREAERLLGSVRAVDADDDQAVAVRVSSSSLPSSAPVGAVGARVRRVHVLEGVARARVGAALGRTRATRRRLRGPRASSSAHSPVAQLEPPAQVLDRVARLAQLLERCACRGRPAGRRCSGRSGARSRRAGRRGRVRRGRARAPRGRRCSTASTSWPSTFARLHAVRDRRAASGLRSAGAATVASTRPSGCSRRRRRPAPARAGRG